VTRERRYDAIVAGAGPAGTAVAARLEQHGRAPNILVLDRYSFPREKPCGGALTGHADPVMAELGLELRVDHFPSTDAKVRFGSYQREIRMGAPVDVIRREEFDADLVQQVRERGVEVIEGEGIKGYENRGDHVLVTTSKGRELEASVLVGADGAASIVRKQLIGKKTIPHRLFKMELTLPASQTPDPAMLYDFTLMASGLRGYLWIFPVPDGRINVGLMHYPARDQRLGGRQLTDLLRQGLADHGVELPDSGTRGLPVWGYHPKARVSEPRVLTVGDAAGIDGLTGEGIAVAMEQAVVAGDLIERGLASDRLEFSDYRRRLRKATVGRELALDRWLSRLLFGHKYWREWLSLVLFDPDVIEMYARRVDGTEILADQKARLYRALFRHLLKRRKRRRALIAATIDEPLQLEAANA
jgi:geranylgeranyl reductase family protein